LRGVIFNIVVDEDRSCSVIAAVGSSTYISSTSEGQPKGQADNSARCGSRTNPWTIEVHTGQTISVSLMDFGQQQQPQTDDLTKDHDLFVADRAESQRDKCDVQYGYVLDKSTDIHTNKNTTICSSPGLQRDRFVYQSKGSRVEIVLSSAGIDQNSRHHKFLLGFEGKYKRNFISHYQTDFEILMRLFKL